MTEYEVKWQTKEMQENNEWGTYYYDKWQDAIHFAWELKSDSQNVTVIVYEIHRIIFKDESDEQE